MSIALLVECLDDALCSGSGENDDAVGLPTETEVVRAVSYFVPVQNRIHSFSTQNIQSVQPVAASLESLESPTPPSLSSRKRNRSTEVLEFVGTERILFCYYFRIPAKAEACL